MSQDPVDVCLAAVSLRRPFGHEAVEGALVLSVLEVVVSRAGSPYTMVAQSLLGSGFGDSVKIL